MRLPYPSLDAAKARARHFKTAHNTLFISKPITHTESLNQFARLSGYADWAELKTTGLDPAAPVNMTVDIGTMTKHCEEITGLNDYWASRLVETTFAFTKKNIDPDGRLGKYVARVLSAGAEAFCLYAGPHSYAAQIRPGFIGFKKIEDIDNDIAHAMMREAIATCDRWSAKNKNTYVYGVMKNPLPGAHANDDLSVSVYISEADFRLKISVQEHNHYAEKTVAVESNEIAVARAGLAGWDGFDDFYRPFSSSMEFPHEEDLENLLLFTPYFISGDKEDLDENGKYDGITVITTHCGFNIPNRDKLSAAIARLESKSPLPAAIKNLLATIDPAERTPGLTRAVIGATLTPGEIDAIASTWRRVTITGTDATIHYEIGVDAVFVTPKQRRKGLVGVVFKSIAAAAQLDISNEESPKKATYAITIHMPSKSSLVSHAETMAEYINMNFDKNAVKIQWMAPKRRKNGQES